MIEAIITEIAEEIAAGAAEIEAAADAKHRDATPGPFGIAVATLDGARSGAKGSQPELRH